VAIIKGIDFCLKQAGSGTKQPEEESEAAAHPQGSAGKNLLAQNLFVLTGLR
jgi:hypothetical protein